MPRTAVATDPDDPYVKDRLLAAAPFDRVEFARTFEHRIARVDGVKLHYVIGGQGPVVVFGHGWPASWYEWRKVMPRLSDRFTCVAFDMPGLGDSAPPPAFDMATVGALLARFIREELGQDSVTAVGHDVSGPPLIHMAAHEAGLVSRLFLTETSIPGPEMGEILARHINEIWHFPMNAARLSATFAAGREAQFIPQFFTEWVYNVGAIAPEDIAEYIRVNSRPGVIECGASYYHSATPQAEGGGPLPPDSLTMPLHFVGADQGFGGHLGGETRAAYSTIKRYATNATYEVVEKCGHWVSEDRPAFLADRIAAFFSDG